MDQQTRPLFDLNLTAEAKGHLTETAKWAKFMAVCGMIFIVLVVVVASYAALVLGEDDPEFRRLSANSGISAESLGAGVVLVYILAGLLYFFPCLFTLQFANKMKLALSSNDDLLLSESFRSLKKTFRFLGVLTIIGLIFMLLSIVASAVGS